MLSQKEVYNQLWKEVFIRELFRLASDLNIENHVDKAMRLASICAVKNTWYWFNNQETFIKYLTYPIEQKV